MNTDTVPQKPKMLHRIINAILLFLSASLALGICSTYSFDMLTFNKKVILIVPAVLLAAFMIIKEIKVRTLARRMYMNMAIFVGFFLIFTCLALIW
jgi:hypothetical protein